MTVSAQALASAGISADGLPQGQQEVLSSLTEAELAVLASIKDRLDAAGTDVEAHGDPEPKQGGVFW